MIIKLEPCRFCGSDPHYVTKTQGTPPFSRLSVCIECTKCNQDKVCSDQYDGDLGLTEASWNKLAMTPTSAIGDLTLRATSKERGKDE